MPLEIFLNSIIIRLLFSITKYKKIKLKAQNNVLRMTLAYADHKIHSKFYEIENFLF